MGTSRRIQFVVMRNHLRSVIVMAWFVGGCQWISPKPVQPLSATSGLKVADLQPANPIVLPAAMNFQIYVYDLPVAELGVFRDVVATMDRESIRSTHPSALAANAVGAGFGRPEMGRPTLEKLVSAGAEQTRSNMLIIFDERGDDLAWVDFPGKGEAVIFESATVSKKHYLGSGRLAWNLKTKPDPAMRGVADVRIEPVFRKKADEISGRIRGEPVPEKVFHPAAFSARMSPGDFLLFGPTQPPGTEPTLSTLLCRSSRKSQDHVTFFLVICTRVQN